MQTDCAVLWLFGELHVAAFFYFISLSLFLFESSRALALCGDTTVCVCVPATICYLRKNACTILRMCA